jgi:sigma-B regulation protein RsbQ
VPTGDGGDRLLSLGVAERNNVVLSGPVDGQPMVFAHGFGCDQNMWRFVAPAFEDRYRVVLFDHVGAGRSDPAAYDREKYASLDGYAADVLEICRELELHDVVFVGHSVSAMIGILAAAADPRRFSRLVLVGPSPRYLDDRGYVGGFTRADVDGLLESLESNYLGWSAAMAPVIMGNPDRPALGEELTNSFCRTDPAIARQFARVTFLSDNRHDLQRVDIPALVLQCRDDVIAPTAVGEFVARELPRAELVLLDATGHCPNLSAPEETVAAIESFLAAPVG